MDDLLLLKVDLLEFVISKGFHVGEYLKQKAVLSIDDTASAKGKGEKRSGNSSERRKRKDGAEESGSTPARKKTAAVEVPSDILHPELYRRLIVWAQCGSVSIRITGIYCDPAESYFGYHQFITGR